jgi:hypothetical protein
MRQIRQSAAPTLKGSHAQRITAAPGACCGTCSTRCTTSYHVRSCSRTLAKRTHHAGMSHRAAQEASVASGCPHHTRGHESCTYTQHVRSPAAAAAASQQAASTSSCAHLYICVASVVQDGPHVLRHEVHAQHADVPGRCSRSRQGKSAYKHKQHALVLKDANGLKS